MWKLVLSYNNTVNSATNFAPNELLFKDNKQHIRIMEQAYSNLLQSRNDRNNRANKNKGLDALKLGDMVWKLLESVDKADPIWSNTVYHVIKGPYDGHHYDIRTPMGKSKLILYTLP